MIRGRPRGRTTPRCAAALLAGALAAAAALAAPAAAQDRFDGVRQQIRQLMTEQDLPSIAVAVAKDGRILWEEAFGWADREARAPATPHTMYSLASISKPITATGLMLLVERGHVNLDRPANTYLGTGRLTGHAGDPDAATVRRIANHSAGLPLHYQFFYENGGYGVPTMDETIARYGIVANPPSTVVQYSNLGFGILDWIVERVSDMPFAEFMRAEVFTPLGLTRMSVGPAPGLEPYMAARYDTRGRRVPFYDFDHAGASAVWASAHDLVRFGMFHLKNWHDGQRQILADSTLDAMQRATSPGAQNGVGGYGIAWNVTREFGLRRVSHTGGMPGVTTVLSLYPEQDLAVVVLANRNGAPVTRIAPEIVAAVVPAYEDSLRAWQQRSNPPSNPPGPRFEAPPELLGEWTGELRAWSGTIPVRMVFEADGDVHVRLGAQLVTLLNDAAFRNGNLTGRFAGTVPAPDIARHAHNIALNVWLRDGKLQGQASAMTTTDPVYYALTSYIELTRTPTGR